MKEVFYAMLPVIYICRHLRKKLERGNHEFKEEMILCLMDLVKDPQDDEAKLETDEQ